MQRRDLADRLSPVKQNRISGEELSVSDPLGAIDYFVSTRRPPSRQMFGTIVFVYQEKVFVAVIWTYVNRDQIFKVVVYLKDIEDT